MDKYEHRRQKLLELRDTLCDGKNVVLAKKIDREPSYVSRMLYKEGKKGKRRIADDMIELIESSFKLPKGWLDDSLDIPHLAGCDDNSFRIDVLDLAVSAGPGVINQEFVEILHSVEYAPDEARHMFDGRKAENIRIINVRGDSMSGTIEPGDLLFVDISVKSFDGDGIYAFLYDDTAHVKRLQKMKDKLLVISDNKIYTAWEPIEKDEMNRVFVFGKVIGSMPQTYRKHG